MLSLIVAEAENRVIGAGGQLPWRLSGDLRRFKQLTLGHTLIMGRKTFDSIGRLLPGRRTIVVTRQADWSFPGALVAHDLDQALRLVDPADETFVVGGAEIYRQALPLVERIYLTRVHARLAGDTFFPELPPDTWQEIRREHQAAGERDDYDCTYLILQRLTSVTQPHATRDT